MATAELYFLPIKKKQIVQGPKFKEKEKRKRKRKLSQLLSKNPFFDY